MKSLIKMLIKFNKYLSCDFHAFEYTGKTDKFYDNQTAKYGPVDGAQMV